MRLFTLLFVFAAVMFPADGPRISQETREYFDMASMAPAKGIWIHVTIPDDDKTTDHVQVTMAYLSDGKMASTTKTIERATIGDTSGVVFKVGSDFQGVQAITAVCQVLSGKSATVTYR